jgi:hypothetical protein
MMRLRAGSRHDARPPVVSSETPRLADRADAGDEVRKDGVARCDLVDRSPQRAPCR